MAFLARSRKQDLQVLAEELGLKVRPEFKIFHLCKLIVENPDYDEEFTLLLLGAIKEEREMKEKLEKEERERKEKLENEERERKEKLEKEERKEERERKAKLEKEERDLEERARVRAFELKKMELELRAAGIPPRKSMQLSDQPVKNKIHDVVPHFNPKEKIPDSKIDEEILTPSSEDFAIKVNLKEFCTEPLAAPPVIVHAEKVEPENRIENVEQVPKNHILRELNVDYIREMNENPELNNKADQNVSFARSEISGSEEGDNQDNTCYSKRKKMHSSKKICSKYFVNFPKSDESVTIDNNKVYETSKCEDNDLNCKKKRNSSKKKRIFSDIFRKKFSGTEKRYSITEKECAAKEIAVKKLQCYLDVPNKFITVMDHTILVWLKHNVKLNPQLMRWAMTLQSYNYMEVPGSGKSHKHADTSITPWPD